MWPGAFLYVVPGNILRTIQFPFFLEIINMLFPGHHIVKYASKSQADIIGHSFHTVECSVALCSYFFLYLRQNHYNSNFKGVLFCLGEHLSKDFYFISYHCHISWWFLWESEIVLFIYSINYQFINCINSFKDKTIYRINNKYRGSNLETFTISIHLTLKSDIDTLQIFSWY